MMVNTISEVALIQDIKRRRLLLLEQMPAE